MKVCPIASGSSGNCIYIGDGATHILIDAGISRKRIVQGLHSIGISPEQLTAICITHEHSDHIMGLKVFLKNYHTPVYATEGTIAYIKEKIEDERQEENFHIVEADCPFEVGSMFITPFHTSHDAIDPIGYTVRTDTAKLGMATDLGCYDTYTVSHLKDCEVLILESNHDISMLQAGTYPYQLKKRILSEKGHLSNVCAGNLLCELIHDKLRYVYLAHLSKENNYPELAFETVNCQLKLNCAGRRGGFKMAVAKRDEPSAMIDLCKDEREDSHLACS